MSKEKLDFAVNQVVNNCMHVKKGERACVITDESTKHIGLAIAECMKCAGAETISFIMEDFGPRPEDGSAPLKLPNEIRSCLDKSDVSIYAAQCKKGELEHFRRPMINLVIESKRIRHGHMPGVDAQIMETGMSADYDRVVDVSKKAYNVLSKARKVRVTTAKGTDFTATLNEKWKWQIDDGQIKPGSYGNLPAGEVFTCPQTFNGKAVIDGVLGDYLLEMFGLIDKTPVHIEFKDGKITRLTCSNKDIENELLKYANQKENANRVGELGIGTNIGLDKLIGNLLQDEKFPGVHVAIGHSFPEKTGADWDCDVHLDMVIQKTTIEVDGRVIMEEGHFKI